MSIMKIKKSGGKIHKHWRVLVDGATRLKFSNFHDTMMDGLAEVKLKEKKATRYEHVCGELPKFTKHLRNWGEAGMGKMKEK